MAQNTPNDAREYRSNDERAYFFETVCLMLANVVAVNCIALYKHNLDQKRKPAVKLMNHRRTYLFPVAVVASPDQDPLLLTAAVKRI